MAISKIAQYIVKAGKKVLNPKFVEDKLKKRTIKKKGRGVVDMVDDAFKAKAAKSAAARQKPKGGGNKVPDQRVKGSSVGSTDVPFLQASQTTAWRDASKKAVKLKAKKRDGGKLTAKEAEWLADYNKRSPSGKSYSQKQAQSARMRGKPTPKNPAVRKTGGTIKRAKGGFLGNGYGKSR